MNRKFIGDFTPESYEFMVNNYGDLWDFTICERPDSSRYGTAAGNQCHKGFKVSRDDVLGDIKKLGVVKNPKALEKLSKLKERDFVRVTERIKQRASEEEITKGLNPKEKAAVKKVTQEVGNKGEEGNRVEAEELSAALTTLYNNSETGVGKSGQALYPPEVAKLYENFQKDDQLAVKRKPISDETLEKVWSTLDRDTKSSLVNKGKPPNEVKQDSERGKLILKQLIETGFKDEITGQPYSWRDLQPDHKRAISTFTKEQRKDVEKGGNLVMTHKGYNSLKGNLEKRTSERKLLGEEASSFVKEGLKREYKKQASKTREEFDRDLKAKVTKGSAAAERRRQIRENSSLWDERTWKQKILDTETRAKDLQAMASGINSRGGPSGRLRETGSGRGSVPRYPPSNFLRVSLLMNRGIPKSEWPVGLEDKAVREITRSLRSADSGKKKYFVNKFKAFTNGGETSTPISNLLKELEN